MDYREQANNFPSASMVLSRDDGIYGVLDTARQYISGALDTLRTAYTDIRSGLGLDSLVIESRSRPNAAPHKAKKRKGWRDQSNKNKGKSRKRKGK